MPLTHSQQLLALIAEADQLVTETNERVNVAESPEQWLHAECLREMNVETRAMAEALQERIRGQQRRVNMDDMKVLIELQREQNALLKKYLWRLRFSLLSLLLLTTATAVGLGILVYRSPPPGPPTGTLQLWATPQPVPPNSWTATPNNPYQLLQNPPAAENK